MFLFSESKPEIVIILLADDIGIIRGVGSIGGEIINSFCILFNLIYSSNWISISGTLKSVEKFAGSALRTIGACSSISPPVGVPLLAQLMTINMINM